jgi:hypothetical protein
MRMLALLLATLTIATVPASAAREPSPRGNDEVDPSIADGSAQRALDSARATWRRRGPRSYAYRLRMSCLCRASTLRPRTFVVRDGRPRKPPKGWKDRATVPRLFKLVQEAIDNRVEEMDVRYRANGSLKLLAVDSVQIYQDDEYSYTVDRFRPLR